MQYKTFILFKYISNILLFIPCIILKMLFCTTDIGALGVCVYKMVALKLQFDASEMQHVVFKITYDEVVRKS